MRCHVLLSYIFKADTGIFCIFRHGIADYFSVWYYTICVSLKLICTSLNVKLCICKNKLKKKQIWAVPLGKLTVLPTP